MMFGYSHGLLPPADYHATEDNYPSCGTITGILKTASTEEELLNDGYSACEKCSELGFITGKRPVLGEELPVGTGPEVREPERATKPKNTRKDNRTRTSSNS